MQILRLAKSNTISLCCSLLQHHNPRERDVGRREDDVPSHISCVRMRPEVAPVFCSLPDGEPTIPTRRHLSPAVHIAEPAQMVANPPRFLSDSHPSLYRHMGTKKTLKKNNNKKKTIKHVHSSQNKS